ncbi:MAG: hypothetical protein LIO97_11740 [Tannerellaceae bacterium]|nr:hypothetical protein [Tannerellaceae bacterium]
MKIFNSSILSLFILFSCTSASGTTGMPETPEQPGDPFKQVALADLYILLYNNIYYAYGTNASDGIEVYTSDDLEIWEKHPTLALYKDNSWGDRWFWHRKYIISLPGINFICTIQ